MNKFIKSILESDETSYAVMRYSTDKEELIYETNNYHEAVSIAKSFETRLRGCHVYIEGYFFFINKETGLVNKTEFVMNHNGKPLDTKVYELEGQQ
ncbi:hypothetical protein H3019_gp33 [Bacillus phage Karezi]|uniref:Uncharacterized protein n=1 Tax=Bacillus phage Karezi TaxID=2591398 RepID=A0A514AAQ0_9CAUD|nr:hypothetical protein H3019_gp33 [Bacillus phage Karezi]QDH50353.1 hypothetical protein KAREZI_33 [Bacillus phage Karezi]